MTRLTFMMKNGRLLTVTHRGRPLPRAKLAVLERHGEKILELVNRFELADTLTIAWDFTGDPMRTKHVAVKHDDDVASHFTAFVDTSIEDIVLHISGNFLDPWA